MDSVQKKLTERLSIPRKRNYYLPLITQSNINNRVKVNKNLQRMKSLKKSKSINKENKPNIKNFGSFCFKTKKIHLKPKKTVKQNKKNKFMKITKEGPIMYKSIISNRKTEFE